MYDPNSLHPAKHILDASDFTLPAHRRTWDYPFPGASLVIASEPAAALRSYGVDLRVAMERRPPPLASRAIAFLLGDDRVLNRLWKGRVRHVQRIVEKGFAAVVAPAYSNWDDCAPYHGLAAVAQSATVADLLAPHVPTVPTVVWRTKKDLRRQVRWLCRGDPRAIAIDLGTGDWHHQVAGLAYARDSFIGERGCVPTLVAHGLSSRSRIAEVGGVWPERVVVASQRPWQLAMAQRRLTDELGAEPEKRIETEQLLKQNATKFEGVVQQLLGSRSPEVSLRAMAAENPDRRTGSWQPGGQQGERYH